MMIGQLGQEKVEQTELSTIWRLCCFIVYRMINMVNTIQ